MPALLRLAPIAVLVTLLAVPEVAGQAVTWTGEVRTRAEVDGRNFDLGSTPNTYTLLRARLGANVAVNEDIRVFVQAQDSRVFGQAGNTLRPLGNLDLHQAYLDARRVFVDPLGVRVGRMELSYGNERLIGAVGFHNVGRAFEGIVADVDFGNTSLDLIATVVRETHAYTPVATPAGVEPQLDEKMLFYGAYAQSRLGARTLLDGYVLWESDRTEVEDSRRALSRATLGTYLRGPITPNLSYQTELALQVGRRFEQDVLAYMLTGALEYRLAGGSLAIGYDHLSGSPADGDRFGAFDPLFHTGHKFYGFMDYFIAVPANTDGRGLIDLYARGRLADVGGVRVELWLHNFWHETAAASGERFLGHEVDLVVGTVLHRALALEGGVSVFQATPLMRDRFRGDDPGVWAYLSARVAF